MADFSPAGIRAGKGGLAGRVLAEREARRLAIVDAAAGLLVLRGWPAHCDVEGVNGRLRLGGSGVVVHSRNALWRATGGYRGLVGRMGEGGLFRHGELGQWSEGLFSGLRLSGALVQFRNKGGPKRATWVVEPNGLRPALEGALAGGLPFSCRASVVPQGLMLYGMWAGNLGGDPAGADVMAGLLMGAVPVRLGGRSWLGVPSTPGARALLESWGIPAGLRGHHAAPRRRVDLVSPFWGALFAWMMPAGMSGWYLAMGEPRRGLPGMCPLLPWAFLRMAGGRISDRFPRGGLPFLCNRDWLYRKGVPLERIHEAAVRELGFSRVDPRLREVWRGHMASVGLGFPFGS